MIRAALLALSLFSTHVVWTARLSAPVGTPAVADGRIYVASGAKHTRLHALDAVTGRREWQAIGGLRPQYTPLVDSGLVLRLSDLGVLRRYDPATGHIFWRSQDGFSEGMLAPPTLAGGRVFELSDALVALDAKTGKRLWTAPGDCFRCALGVDSAHVYAAGKEGLRAYDVATGQVAWTAPGFADLDTASSTVVSDGIVVVPSTRNRQKTPGDNSKYIWSFWVEAFRSSDGKALWRVRLPNADGFDPWIQPVAADGLVVCQSVGGMLYAIDLHTGAVRWRANIGSTDSTPAIANGVVWVVGGDNRLHALSATTGGALWSSQPIKVDPDLPTPSPVLDGNLVLLGTAAGNLIAYGS